MKIILSKAMVIMRSRIPPREGGVKKWKERKWKFHDHRQLTKVVIFYILCKRLQKALSAEQACPLPDQALQM